METAKTSAIIVLYCSSAVFGADAAKLLKDATAVVATPSWFEKVPQDALNDARCILLVPGVKTVRANASGKGFVSCKNNTVANGWTAPTAIRFAGSNAVKQSDTDAVMLLMKQDVVEKLTKRQLSVGGQILVEAGPESDNPWNAAQKRADVLTYSHKGSDITGMDIQGFTIRSDDGATKELYGADVKSSEILRGKAPKKVPVEASRFTLELKKFSPARRASLPPPRASTPSSLTWNPWFEEAPDSPSAYTPVSALLPNTPYRLMLDLSAFNYAPADSNFAAAAVSNRLLDYLKSHTEKSDVALEAALIPDPAYFVGGTSPAQSRRVGLQKMRDYFASNVAPPPDAFAVLKKQMGEADFEFGHWDFKVTTGSKEGLAFLGISVWANGLIPLDEIRVPVCITSTEKRSACPSAPLWRNHGDTMNAIPLLSETDLPVAFFHYIEFDASRGVGVFRKADWEPGKYLRWPMNNLSQRLGEVTAGLLKNFQQDSDDDAFAQTGDELFKTLLPETGLDAPEARREFEALIAATPSPTPENPPPQILVRLSTLDPTSGFALPIGMMAVSVDGKRRFLGDTFRIVSPLASQDYRPLTKCIDRWVMVMPPNDPKKFAELATAEDQFTIWSTACKDKDCINTLPDYAKWIGTPTPEETSPTALMLLSHYENRSLTFDHTNPVSAKAVSRSFAQPSLAIINACGAATPGADDLVNSLNSAGFQSIIATTTTVTPVMAGKYFNWLAQELQNHGGTSGYNISRAHFDAIQQLRNEKAKPADRPYGPKALIYSLLGNGALELCALPVSKPQ